MEGASQLPRPMNPTWGEGSYEDTPAISNSSIPPALIDPTLLTVQGVPRSRLFPWAAVANVHNPLQKGEGLWDARLLERVIDCTERVKALCEEKEEEEEEEKEENSTRGLDEIEKESEDASSSRKVFSSKNPVIELGSPSIFLHPQRPPKSLQAPGMYVRRGIHTFPLRAATLLSFFARACFVSEDETLPWVDYFNFLLRVAPGEKSRRMPQKRGRSVIESGGEKEVTLNYNKEDEEELFG